MPRFYLRPILTLITLFTAALLLIHAQPYDDHELRDLLLPADCPAPCFMGIRPQVTTMEETMNILEASNWVKQYELNSHGNQVSIRWNNNSPIWFDGDDANTSSSILFVDGLADAIRVDTNLTFGDVQLIFGNSSLQYVGTDNFKGHNYIEYSAIYPNLSLLTLIFMRCDTKNDHITYRAKVVLNYQKLIIRPEFRNSYHASWNDVLHTRCP